MLMQIRGALVSGEFRGFFQSVGKDTKVTVYGQLAQVDERGEETKFNYRVKDETAFKDMKKGDKVDVLLNIIERDFQGRKYTTIDLA